MSFDFKRLVKFEHNIGEKEKKYRLYAGVALVAIAIFTAQIAFLVIGVVLIATGFSGWCPAYSAMNKNTGCCAETTEATASTEETNNPSESSNNE